MAPHRLIVKYSYPARLLIGQVSRSSFCKVGKTTIARDYFHLRWFCVRKEWHIFCFTSDGKLWMASKGGQSMHCINVVICEILPNKSLKPASELVSGIKFTGAIANKLCDRCFSEGVLHLKLDEFYRKGSCNPRKYLMHSSNAQQVFDAASVFVCHRQPFSHQSYTSRMGHI